MLERIISWSLGHRLAVLLGALVVAIAGLLSLIAFSTYLGMAVGPVQGLLGLYMALFRVQVCLEQNLGDHTGGGGFAV